MLHDLDDEGNMKWMCRCGKENTAHVSHEQVEHPVQDEYESVIEGEHTDEQGRTWTRTLTRPTGTRIVHAGVVGLPPCDCGTRTFLKATFTDEEYADIPRHDEQGQPTQTSVAAAHRHMAVAVHLKRLGKGPEHLKGQPQIDQQATDKSTLKRNKQSTKG
jgi:hypothetical protein